MLPNIKNKKLNRVYQSKGKMRYGSRQYSNPFFEEKIRSQKGPGLFLSLKIKIIFSIILICIIALVWFLFYANYFMIKKINIEGSGKISPEQIEKLCYEHADERFFSMLPKRNIFLFDISRLKEKLNSNYSFNDLEVTKKIPDEINIRYTEKEYALIWKEGDKYYYVGSGGEVISETDEKEVVGKNYPQIENLSDRKIDNRKVSIDQKIIDFAVAAFIKMKDYQSEFKAGKIIVDNDANTVKIQLLDGPLIYLNTERPLEEQIEKLLIIKNEKIKDDFKSKTYIDLRVGNSVYYR